MKIIGFRLINGRIIRFKIDNFKVIYFDDIWKEGIQIYPKDSQLILKLIKSKKPKLQMMAALILDANKGKDLEEYKSCNGNEEKLAEFIRKDCKSKGYREVGI